MKSNNRISEGMQVTGNIDGTGSLLVEGTVDGKIQLDGSITVGPSGLVAATISAEELTIEGRVNGDVTAAAKVRLNRGAQLDGTLRAPIVDIDLEASFKGRLIMPLELPVAKAPAGSGTRK